VRDAYIAVLGDTVDHSNPRRFSHFCYRLSANNVVYAPNN